MTALRWILVGPAALAGAVLIAFPLHWLALANFSEGTDGAFLTMSREGIADFERVAQAFVAPVGFIGLGVATAPTRKWLAGIVLAVAFALLWTAIMVWLGPRAAPTAFGVVLSVLGVGAGLLIARALDRQESPGSYDGRTPNPLFARIAARYEAWEARDDANRRARLDRTYTAQEIAHNRRKEEIFRIAFLAVPIVWLLALWLGGANLGLPDNEMFRPIAGGLNVFGGLITIWCLHGLILLAIARIFDVRD